MNLDNMNEIQRRGGRFWNVSTVAELFDSPLPTNDSNGNEIEDWQDLCIASGPLIHDLKKQGLSISA